MTEQEWLACAEPQRMLEFLEVMLPNTSKRCPSPRKLRLFACACCRQVWDKLTDDAPCPDCVNGLTDPRRIVTTSRSRQYGYDSTMAWDSCKNCSGTGRINRSRRAVDMGEKFADGLASKEEMRLARDSLPNTREPGFREAQLVLNCVFPDGWDQWRVVSELAANGWGVPLAWQADLLRHIVGNPYDDQFKVRWGECHEHAKGCAPKPVQWITPLALDLARSLYDGVDCAFALHDALEQEGAPAELVEHFADECPQCDGTGKRGYCKTCRGTWNRREGECMCSDQILEIMTCEFCHGISHPKGCWALDLLLNKE